MGVFRRKDITAIPSLRSQLWIDSHSTTCRNQNIELHHLSEKNMNMKWWKLYWSRSNYRQSARYSRTQSN